LAMTRSVLSATQDDTKSRHHVNKERVDKECVEGRERMCPICNKYTQVEVGGKLSVR